MERGVYQLRILSFVVVIILLILLLVVIKQNGFPENIKVSEELPQQPVIAPEPQTANENKAPIVEKPSIVTPAPKVLFEEAQIIPVEHAYDTAVLDYNLDGKGDIAIANYQRQNYLLVRDNKGEFTKSPQFGMGSTNKIAIGNFDGDEYPDIVVTNFNAPTTVYLNNGSGFIKRNILESLSAKALAVSDINNDGFDDIIVGVDVKDSRVLINNKGSFEVSRIDKGKKYHTTSLAVCDLNNDGLKDLILGNDFQKDSIYLKTSTGFVESELFGGKTHTQSVVCADMNNDGFDDIIIGNNKQAGNEDKNYIYFNDGTVNGTIKLRAVPSFGAGKNTDIAVADFDGDGYLDIVFANYDEKSFLYLNNHDETFREHISFDKAYTKGVAVGDINGDGRFDIIFSNDIEGITIYRGVR